MAASNSRAPVSVLVPAFNEEATIGLVIDKLLKLPFVKEIIVVDDCSKDRTAEIVEEKRRRNRKIRLLRHSENQGKTAAIKTAVQDAQGSIVIIQDADLEYSPSEMINVVSPIINGVADVVYGSRFLVRREARVLYYGHFLANRFLTTLSNIFTNLNMTDIETGYKALRTPLLKSLVLTSSGFGMEAEITAHIARLPIRIYETPISYYGRTYEEGKKIGMKDGIMAILYIFYYNILGVRLPSARKYRNTVRDFLNSEIKR